MILEKGKQERRRKKGMGYITGRKGVPKITRPEG